MKIEISFAKIKDARELTKVDKIANKEFKWWHPSTKRDFEKVIKKSKYLVVVAKDDEKIVGYLEANFKGDKETIWIENVYTIQKFRNRQIAKKLMNKFVKNWKNKVNNIVLLTADRNKKILGRLGFKKTMNYMEFVS